MMAATQIMDSDYWDHFEVSNTDLSFINNHLFEIETPQTTQEILVALVQDRINREKTASAAKQAQAGKSYLPEASYKKGEGLVFPALNFSSGTVTSVRAGHNPEVGEFQVMQVKMSTGETRSFAMQLAEHALNHLEEDTPESASELIDQIIESHADSLSQKLEDALATDPDLALVTGAWFPRALFVDINIGQLNLAEAILEMAEGGPLTTQSLMEQLELSSGDNTRLIEFSLNLALQEDPRFDEVGPTGEVLWYLNRLEPQDVRQTPQWLQYNELTFNRDLFTPQMLDLETILDDELCTVCKPEVKYTKAEIILTYPHWRAGTLPLTSRTMKLFPTALESPRIQFQFVDGDNKEKFPGWVVRPQKYVSGLSAWFEENGIIPGSLITILKANANGEVTIKVEKRKIKEWLRTVLVGKDGGIVFALLKQQVMTTYDERMATVVPDITALDQSWKGVNYRQEVVEQMIVKIAQELTKLNPQGHFHVQELYSAVNVVKRCPPEVVFNSLLTSPSFNHVGDLYYRISDQGTQE